MRRFDALFRVLRVLSLLTLLLVTGAKVSRAKPEPSNELMGMVKSRDGKPMKGVAVSARAQGKTFTTSVYTNDAGDYYFPSLPDGQYRIWAQAVGFVASHSEQSVSSGKKSRQDFTLDPLHDFYKQLSGEEWLDGLPSSTAEDRRMRNVLYSNCTECHAAGFILAKQFDAAGWTIVVNTMMNYKTAPETPERRLIQAYKQDLINYLARVRGPEPIPLKFKTLPRPGGNASEIIVTEYDVPLGDQADTVVSDYRGSDWSQGIASRYEGYVHHDAVVGTDGNIYLTDHRTPVGTVGKLDPRTGRITKFKVLDENGFAVATHGAAVDTTGNIWLTNQTEGTVLEFDPVTEKFRRFPKPASMTRGIGGTIAVDSKGNAWATESNGVFRVNLQTAEYTEYKSATPGGDPSGVTLDAEDNAWFAQLAADRIGVVDSRTGQVSEVVLSPLDEEVSDKDREIGDRSEIGKTNGASGVAAPLYMKGPRRIGADRNGDTVWVGEFWAGRLAKINIHTRKVTEYKVPGRYSHPYDIVVDKNHMVWFCMSHADGFTQFNPVTEKFTEYPLPTLGTNIRFLSLDDTTALPTIWLPYSGTNKIARVQFRKMPAASMLSGLQ